MNDESQTQAQFDYTLPVSRLLDIGDPRDTHTRDWPDYPEQYQLTQADIPELVRMATDRELYGMAEETNETWAGIHAWRALAQLRAVETVPALLTLFPRVEEEDDEWVLEEMPHVMGMIGPEAIPHLAAYLTDPGQLVWARIPAASALEQIGKRHPEARGECVAALMNALKAYQETDPDLNASIVASLADLKSVEAAPLVEESFRADRVNEMVMGDWEDYQISVGLLDERLPHDDDFVLTSPYEHRLPPPVGHKAKLSPEKKEKKKLKQAKQMRRKNRKKK